MFTQIPTKLPRKQKKVFVEYAKTFKTKVDRHGDLYLQKAYHKCARRAKVTAPPFNNLWNLLSQRGLSGSEINELYSDIVIKSL